MPSVRAMFRAPPLSEQVVPVVREFRRSEPGHVFDDTEYGYVDALRGEAFPQVDDVAW